MAITVAQPADSSVEPTPAEFAEKAAEVALRVRDARISASVERLVAFRAARGRP